jgi:hypothetical protein
MRTVAPQAAAKSSQVADVPDRERDLLCLANKLFVANAARQPSALVDGLQSLLDMDMCWGPATDQRCPGALRAQEAWTT